MLLFGEFLVEKGDISAEQLVKALVEQSARLPSIIEVVFQNNILSSEDLLKVRVHVYDNGESHGGDEFEIKIGYKHIHLKQISEG